MSVKNSLRGARLLPVALLAPGVFASVRIADLAAPRAPAVEVPSVPGPPSPAPADADLPGLITALADKEARAAAYAKLVANPPRAALVALLANPSLALRVGALEVLEDIGGSSGFDPWLEPGDSANAAALSLWKKWAAAPDAAPGAKGGALTDDRRLSYLRDILGDKADKARRAAGMLARDGAASVGFLEKHLLENPGLPAGLRGRIRETEYAIVLSGALGDNAASVANRLVFGNRDAMLAAMESLRSTGAVATPVLRDFLTHADPLVRESACDIILVCGRAEAFPLVEEALRDESDPNVIQGALRPMKDIRTKEAAAFIARHIAGKDEELALAALRVAGSQSEGERAADAAAVTALGSPSWRVRAGALEYVALRTPAGAKDAVVKLLDDKDDFVVSAAIKAATSLRLEAALPKLREMFLKNPALAGPVFAAYAGNGASPFGGSSGQNLSRVIDETMLVKLAEAPADDRIAVIQSSSGAKALLPTVRRLAGDKDSDVACAALRALASDSDRVGDAETSATLAAALASGPEEKRLAVLGGLRLPSGFLALVPQTGATAAEPDEEAGEPNAPTTLDGMFSAFDGPAAAPAEIPVAKENSGALFGAFGTAETPAVAPGKTAGAGPAALLRELVALTLPAADPRLRLLASGALAGAGHPAGLATLERDYDALDTARRAALADTLPAVKAAAPLFRRLLADPVDEVRRDAASAALDSDAPVSIASLPFAELSRPGSPLKAHELYGYRFENALNETFVGSGFIRKWAEATLAAPDAAPATRVLACIVLRDRAAAAPALEKLAVSSESLWVRRAAWFSLLNAKPREISRLAGVIAGDPSPFVREVLPGALLGRQGGWIHRFDDLNQKPEERWNSDTVAPRLTPEAEIEVRKLAESDPVPSVRFAAQFALLAQGRTFDADALARLVGAGPEQEKRVERVTSWLGSNVSRVTPAMRPVIAVARLDALDRSSRSALLARLGGKGKASVPLTFTAYAGTASPAVSEAPVSATETPAAAPVAPGAAAEFAVVFFHKPGCRECARTREFLDMLRRDFPGMKVEEHDILANDGVLLNQAVCTRLDIPAAKHGLAPAVFTRAGGVVLGDISPGALAKLFARSLELPGDDAWRLTGDSAKADAAKAVDSRYDSLTLGVVVLAGLVDGLNPCAFATIIFFLSYLRITRRSSREMLFTGTAFIAGVFIAYYAAGLALHGLLAELHRFAWLQRGMNLIFGVLALVAAGLSVVDALRARRGEFSEMTLKLPAFLGDRIRKTIREGAKARAFVTAAFVTGVIVSFIELACTGQVYAPIVYKIGAGHAGAAGMLLVYNLAFILPLVALFIATWFGLKNDALLAFQKRHTATVKFALAGLFLILAGVIFFGV